MKHCTALQLDSVHLPEDRHTRIFARRLCRPPIQSLRYHWAGVPVNQGSFSTHGINLGLKWPWHWHGTFKGNMFFRVPNLTKGQDLDLIRTYRIAKIKYSPINQMCVTLGMRSMTAHSGAQACHPCQTQSTHTGDTNLNRKASYRSINPVLYCRW